MTPHVHHWFLPPPAGETSVGTCRDCKAERVFKNWAEDARKPKKGGAAKQAKAKEKA